VADEGGVAFVEGAHGGGEREGDVGGLLGSPLAKFLDGVDDFQ
jgi:hypothetical protein